MAKEITRTWGYRLFPLKIHLKESESFDILFHQLNQDKQATTATRLLQYLFRTQKRTLDHLATCTSV